MANTIYKRKLSGSTDGKQIKIVQTATAGTTIHTAVAGTTAGTFDEVWIWAYNSDTVARVLTLEWGEATAPDGNIKVTVPSQAGLMLITPGLILQNGMVVKAFASAANVVILTGYINTMTDA
jgi:hypothetical protein